MEVSEPAKQPTTERVRLVRKRGNSDAGPRRQLPILPDIPGSKILKLRVNPPTSDTESPKPLTRHISWTSNISDSSRSPSNSSDRSTSPSPRRKLPLTVVPPTFHSTPERSPVNTVLKRSTSSKKVPSSVQKSPKPKSKHNHTRSLSHGHFSQRSPSTPKRSIAPFNHFNQKPVSPASTQIYGSGKFVESFPSEITSFPSPRSKKRAPATAPHSRSSRRGNRRYSSSPSRDRRKKHSKSKSRLREDIDAVRENEETRSVAVSVSCPPRMFLQTRLTERKSEDLYSRRAGLPAVAVNAPSSICEGFEDSQWQPVAERRLAAIKHNQEDTSIPQTTILNDARQITPGKAYEAQKAKLSNGLAMLEQTSEFVHKFSKLQNEYGTELSKLATQYHQQLSELKENQYSICESALSLVGMVGQVGIAHQDSSEQTKTFADRMQKTFEEVTQHKTSLEQGQPQLTAGLRKNVLKIEKSKEQSEKLIEVFVAKKNDLDIAADKERDRVSSLVHRPKSGPGFLRQKGKTAQEKIVKIRSSTRRQLTETYDACLHHQIYVDSFNNSNKKYFEVQIPKLVEDMERLDKVWAEHFAKQLEGFTNSQQELSRTIEEGARNSKVEIDKIDIEHDTRAFHKFRNEWYGGTIVPVFVYDLSRSPNELEKVLDSLKPDKSSPIFDDMLSRNKTLRNYFRMFLQSSLCVENLDFYYVIEKYMAIEDAFQRKETAKEIYMQYIDDDSPRMVNIPFSVRKEINKNLSKGYVNLYRHAQLAIMKLMKQDSFPKFLRSTSYAKYEERISQ